ncbi:hypothetical protein DIPPA_20099 [Diplonema papillatum]|nr:hypothetical protein DIPPA_20099 [Diplonema papillatum]
MPKQGTSGFWYFKKDDRKRNSDATAWQPYSGAEGARIERAFQGKHKSVAVGDYVLYFEEMVQRRKDDKNKERPVMRQDVVAADEASEPAASPEPERAVGKKAKAAEAPPADPPVKKGKAPEHGEAGPPPGKKAKLAKTLGSPAAAKKAKPPPPQEDDETTEDAAPAKPTAAPGKKANPAKTPQSPAAAKKAKPPPPLQDDETTEDAAPAKPKATPGKKAKPAKTPDAGTDAPAAAAAAAAKKPAKKAVPPGAAELPPPLPAGPAKKRDFHNAGKTAVFGSKRLTGETFGFLRRMFAEDAGGGGGDDDSDPGEEAGGPEDPDTVPVLPRIPLAQAAIRMRGPVRQFLSSLGREPGETSPLTCKITLADPHLVCGPRDLSRVPPLLSLPAPSPGKPAKPTAEHAAAAAHPFLTSMDSTLATPGSKGGPGGGGAKADRFQIKSKDGVAYQTTVDELRDQAASAIITTMFGKVSKGPVVEDAAGAGTDRPNPRALTPEEQSEAHYVAVSGMVGIPFGNTYRTRSNEHRAVLCVSIPGINLKYSPADQALFVKNGALLRAAVFQRIKETWAHVLHVMHQRGVKWPVLCGIGCGAFKGDFAEVPSLWAEGLVAQLCLRDGYPGFEGVVVSLPAAPAESHFASFARAAAARGAELQTPLVLSADRSMVTIADKLSERRRPAGILNPSDAEAVRRGRIGMYWEGGHIALEEILAMQTTLLVQNIGLNPLLWTMPERHQVVKPRVA